MKELNGFTVERLEKWISAGEAAKGHHDGVRVSGECLTALARIALAAKRAEPVTWWTGPEPTLTGELESYHDHETGSHYLPLVVSLSAYNTTPQLNSPEIPDGWKLVPIEPTQNMVDAHISGMQLAGFSRAYRDMLATAPDAIGFDPSLPWAEATVITHYHTPDGYKLVPTEITKAMRDAWDSAPNGHEDDDVNMCNAYRAMIAAAPEKPL
ncbi:hypothetical protein [Yersinia enterocolitica]